MKLCSFDKEPEGMEDVTVDSSLKESVPLHADETSILNNDLNKVKPIPT
jgi:hypothetical protein